MRALNTNIMIFSVFQKGVSKELNTSRHNAVLQSLKRSNTPCIELQGKYDGNEELSILVEGFEHRQDVEYFCREYSQECYLESYNDRATSLVYPDGRRQPIGTLTNVSESEAKASIGYSFNPISEQYFITK